MKIKALMYAYEDGKEREIEIPDSRWEKASLTDRLEAAFEFGQNDFQPRHICSVSVGDVIDMAGEGLYLVCGLGFRKMSPEELETWKSIPRRDRLLHRWARMP